MKIRATISSRWQRTARLPSPSGATVVGPQPSRVQTGVLVCAVEAHHAVVAHLGVVEDAVDDGRPFRIGGVRVDRGQRRAAAGGGHRAARG